MGIFSESKPVRLSPPEQSNLRAFARGDRQTTPRTTVEPFDMGAVEEAFLSEETSAASKRKRSAQRVLRIARFMDDSFTIPVLGRKFGWDNVFGMIPVIGDGIGAAISALLIFEAYRAGVPKSALVRMFARMGLDAAIGSVPVLGDLFDFFFKANRANARTAMQHIVPMLEAEGVA